MSQHIFREFTKQSPIQLPSVCGTLAYCYAEQMSWKAGAAETRFPPRRAAALAQRDGMKNSPVGADLGITPLYI